MKWNEQAKRERGILLIECVIYAALFIVVAGLSFAAFYAAWMQHRDLARNADQIVRVTQAGERWRREVRSGVVDIREKEARLNDGQIIYRMDGDRLIRVEGTNPPVVVLEEIKTSQMVRVDGQAARACRWELELARPQKAARVAPLFVFMAVPGK